MIEWSEKEPDVKPTFRAQLEFTANENVREKNLHFATFSRDFAFFRENENCGNDAKFREKCFHDISRK